MKPGEKLILPLWFRASLVIGISVTLILSFMHRPATLSQTVSHGNAIASQQLKFIDREGGTVSIINAGDNTELAVLQVGEDGFMRSVMRGLANRRKSLGLGPEIPFELTLWEDGLVSLIDPATQKRVELSAFGKDNVAAFTRLLPAVLPQS